MSLDTFKFLGPLAPKPPGYGHSAIGTTIGVCHIDTTKANLYPEGGDAIDPWSLAAGVMVQDQSSAVSSDDRTSLNHEYVRPFVVPAGLYINLYHVYIKDGAVAQPKIQVFGQVPDFQHGQEDLRKWPYDEDTDFANLNTFWLPLIDPDTVAGQAYMQFDAEEHAQYGMPHFTAGDFVISRALSVYTQGLTPILVGIHTVATNISAGVIVAQVSG